MKCSVFLPYYNDEKYLKQTIDSILTQTFNDFELVLVNHASTDNSKEIAHSYKDSRIVHIDMDSNIGGGGSLVFLKFLEHAKGEYVKLFCADDVMLPNCLEKLVSFLDNNKKYNCVSSKMVYCDENLKPKEIQPFIFEDFKKNHIKLLFNGISPFTYPTVMIKREIIKNEYVDRVALQYFDVKLWVNLLLAGNKFGFVNEDLVLYRMHSGQMSGNHDPKIIQREKFESLTLLDIFLDKITPKVAYENFPEIDIDDELLKFNLARLASTVDNKSIKLSGFYHLHKIMQDDHIRNKVYQKYGFDIGDFRDIMLYKENSILVDFSAKQLILLLIKKTIFLILKTVSICKKK